MVSGPTLPKYMVVEIINLPIVDKLGGVMPLVKPTVAKAEVLSNNKSKKLPSSVRVSSKDTVSIRAKAMVAMAKALFIIS